MADRSSQQRGMMKARDWELTADRRANQVHKRIQYIFLYRYAVRQLMVPQGLHLHFSIMTSDLYPLGCLGATWIFNFHISFFDVAHNRNQC